jgi:DNA repair protein RecN (Recombination protein N)
VAGKKSEIKEISLKNIGVIEEASIELGSGFNVLTGETGAGKTMILTALNLLSGSKSDSSLIRSGSERLSASALISLPKKNPFSLEELLDEHNPAIEDQSLILSRIILRDGKSKALISGEPTTNAILGKFSSNFFEIHGQSTNNELLQSSRQLEILDGTSEKIIDAKELYQNQLKIYLNRKKEINELEAALKNRDHESEKLRDFIGAMKKLGPIRDEYENLIQLITRLDNSQRWQSALAQVSAALDHEDHGALINIATGKKALESIAEDDKAIGEIISRLDSQSLELRDISYEISGLLSSLAENPDELDRLRERKALLQSFHNKYISFAISDSDLNQMENDINAGINNLLDNLAPTEIALENLSGGDDQLIRMRDQLKIDRDALIDLAKKLSKERKDAAKKLLPLLDNEISSLGLSGSRVDISIEVSDCSSEKDFSHQGIDQVAFLFASHPTAPLLALGKGASGGELSRLMLAFELVLSKGRSMGTLIFDEIDTGIGGEAALVIGQRLSQLSKDFQIIVITHLAQVAVWAENHYVVNKTSDGQYVNSSLQLVTGQERIGEIARMLSGQGELDVAKDHARQLLEHAKNV